MTTLIYVGNSEGCVGRCDAKCYDAVDPECRCLCGGRNDGVGLVEAVINTTEMIDAVGVLRVRMLAMGGDRVIVQPELDLGALGDLTAGGTADVDVASDEVAHLPEEALGRDATAYHPARVETSVAITLKYTP